MHVKGCCWGFWDSVMRTEQLITTNKQLKKMMGEIRSTLRKSQAKPPLSPVTSRVGPVNVPKISLGRRTKNE